MHPRHLFLLGFLAAVTPGLAKSPVPPTEPDKSGYTLFNPTPEALLRDLDTDRPDKTTSPHTVDAGHFQVESDFLRFSYLKESGSRSETWGWGATDFRVGLTNWADLQFFVPFYQSTRVTDSTTGRVERNSGIGDLSVILKANFWGNDSGDTAGGGVLFVKTPTASHAIGNGKVEGGALFLLQSKLPGDFDLTFNTGAGVAADDEGGGYHAEILNIVNLSHDLTDSLAAYAEFFSSVPTRQGGDWVGTIDLGLTLKVGRNLQFDAGLNIGVTRGSDDLEPFLGLSYRF